jgi:hypothetical protein
MEETARRLADAQMAGILEFPCSVERLPDGNTLISDAGSESGRGSEVIEVNPEGEVVWVCGGGQRFTHAARRLPSGSTIVADTNNDRIFEVDRDGRTLFSSEQWGGGKGLMSDGTGLSYPNNIFVMGNDLFMVTSRNSNRFVVVDRAGRIHMESRGELKHPHNCEALPNGNVIVADSDHNRAREMDAEGRVVWEYDVGLQWPRDANRLPNGNTLIADSKNSRVIEVTPGKEIAWEYKVEYFANFYEAVRLPNGNTLISDQQHKQVLEVSPGCEVVWKFRNFRRDAPIYEKLVNGFFKRKDETGMPADWILATRFSEGGGQFVWGNDDYGRPVIPGMLYDRRGALCCQQSVKVQPGSRYTMGGQIRTEDLDGFACFQVAFCDAAGGLLCDVTRAPKGESFAGTTGWTQDSFEVVVPERADSADIRVFVTGKGAVHFKELRFFC